MTDKTDSEIVFAHGKKKNQSQAFLEVLRESPPEQKEAILAYIQALNEKEQEKINQSEEQKNA